jgi:hypothetical protein
VNPETQVNCSKNKGNKTMSNEQLMQEELKKAMGSVNEVATDELSDEELETVAGGRRFPRPSRSIMANCVRILNSRRFTTVCGGFS